MKRWVILVNILLLVLPAYSQISSHSYETDWLSNATRNDNASVGWAVFQNNSMHNGYLTGNAPDTNNVLWTFDANETYHFSPVISNDKVFFATRFGSLYALNMATGDAIWTFSGNRTSQTPAVTDNSVFVGTEYEGIYALNQDNGSVIWQFNGRDNEFLEISSAVVVADNKIFFGCHLHYHSAPHLRYPRLFALDVDDGNVIWAFEPDNGSSVRTPAIGQGKVIFGITDPETPGDFYCVDENGNNDGNTAEYASTNLLWTFNRTGGYGVRQAPPTIDNDRVFINYDTIYSLYLENGTEIYGFNSESLYWAGDFSSSSPALYNDNLYISSREGEFFCIDKWSGKIIWKFEKEEYSLSSSSSPAIADGKVFFNAGRYNPGERAKDGLVFALNIKTGDEIWDFAFDKDCADISPSLSNSILFTGTERGKIYAFGDDSDFDGYNNTVEELCGTDPYDAASIPPDLDSDFIPDIIDEDRDGDGYPNEEDDFPDDPEKWEREEADYIWFIITFVTILLLVIVLVCFFIYRKRTDQPDEIPSTSRPKRSSMRKRKEK